MRGRDALPGEETIVMLTPETQRSTLSKTASKSQDRLNEECFIMHHTQYDPARVCVVGIDLAKDHCDAVGFNERRAPVFEWPRISYPELMNRLAQLPPAAVLMEACNGAHDKARRIADLGHDARLVNAADVKAVRNTRHKNDRRDARYIATLFFLPDIKYVQVKTSVQQDRQLLIREYKGYQRIRIELGNRIHSALEQYGIPTRQGMQRLACHLTEYLDERAEKITPILRETVLRLFESWKRALADEEAAKRRLEVQAARDADAKRLMTIPGIGAIIALYMQAHIGNPHRFKNSRQAAASIGLVPRQYSTGGRDTLLHISKRGPTALRSALIQGAGSVYIWSEKLKGALGEWVCKLKDSRKRYGVIICAIASKLARICWRILRDRTVYQPNWQAAHSV